LFRPAFGAAVQFRMKKMVSCLKLIHTPTSIGTTCTSSSKQIAGSSSR
jgi:hypothetical protein